MAAHPVGLGKSPRASDVFVVQRGRRWVVGVFGHPLLVAWRSPEVAKARARDFARAQGIDAWFAVPGAAIHRLASYRQRDGHATARRADGVASL